jgi:hypothetical protein
MGWALFGAAHLPGMTGAARNGALFHQGSTVDPGALSADIDLP